MPNEKITTANSTSLTSQQDHNNRSFTSSSNVTKITSTQNNGETATLTYNRNSAPSTTSSNFSPFSLPQNQQHHHQHHHNNSNQSRPQNQQQHQHHNRNSNQFRPQLSTNLQQHYSRPCAANVAGSCFTAAPMPQRSESGNSKQFCIRVFTYFFSSQVKSTNL
jgi:hypothetical protein